LIDILPVWTATLSGAEQRVRKFSALAATPHAEPFA
jgi:hypothetical protein